MCQGGANCICGTDTGQYQYRPSLQQRRLPVVQPPSASRLVITFGGKVIFDADVDTFECNHNVPMRRYYEDRIIPEPVPPATLELKATQEIR